MSHNALYAQSGGVTAVINASAYGIITEARKSSKYINKLFVAHNGILGVLREELIDTTLLSSSSIDSLLYTPGGAFGSCRYKLKSHIEHKKEYKRLFSIFKEYDIRYFFYNGGGDSQDTTSKIAEYAASIGYSINCIGIPKTIDNDLPCTDTCPGFGSVAKYVAVSTLEAGLDLASMCNSSTKVFILEVMGRNSGWIAAASSLAQKHPGSAPHIILLPERVFNKETFLFKVKETVRSIGYCVIVASEGCRDINNNFLHATNNKDAFGHVQLGGGVASFLSLLINNNLGLKTHFAVADYLQRAASHIASKTDIEQACALGKAAVRCATQNKNGVMVAIERTNHDPYSWKIAEVSLKSVANLEKQVPNEYITLDGFGITKLGKQYLQPLIEGEHYPPYTNGIPNYLHLDIKKLLISKKLAEFA